MKNNVTKYQDPAQPLIDRINTSKANFVQRLLDPNRKHIQNWVNPLSISTHKLGWAHDSNKKNKQGAFVYPEVQEIDGELIDFTHPSHRRSEGINSAIERRDTVRMTPEQAEWFTTHYKEYYPTFKKGGSIHIKKKNRGKFTESAKRAGMGIQEFARHVLANKEDYSSTQIKRANFARNSKKFKHENGGVLKYKNPSTPLSIPEGSIYGGELEPSVIKPAPIKAELKTYYPFISKYPWTGHSELILKNVSPEQRSINVTRDWDSHDYNLVLNNCSDATRCAIEQVYNEKVNPFLFTTPGDVRDFLLKKGVDKVKTDKGVDTQYFEIPFATAMDIKNQVIDQSINDYKARAKKIKKDMQKFPQWQSTSYDKSVANNIEKQEASKYVFQPFVE